MAVSLSPRALGRGLGSVARRVPGSVVLSVAFLGLVAVCVLFSSVLVPGALDQHLALGVTPAGTPGHLLGTDKVGRDVLALTIAGARSAVVGPIVIAVGSMVAGLIFGMSAAWRGGLWDACVSRSCEVLLSLPVTLLAIVVAGVIGGSYWVTVGVLIVLFAPSDVRMIRSADARAKAAALHRGHARAGPVRSSYPRRPYPAEHHADRVGEPLCQHRIRARVPVRPVLPGPRRRGAGRRLGAPALRTDAPSSPRTRASVTAGLAIIVTATAINIAGDWFAERKERD